MGGGNWPNGARLCWKPSANLWCLSKQERAWFSGTATGAPVSDEVSDFRGLCSAIDFRRQSARRSGPSPTFVLTTLLTCALTPVVASPILRQVDNTHAETAASVAEYPFTLRLKDGQKRFQLGETITIELGYGVESSAPVDSQAKRPDRPGLAVDELRLEPCIGVVDPLRDYLASVGGWDGPPPRSVRFIETKGSWRAVEINDWFQFGKPGKYRLTVLAHAVPNAFSVLGNRPAGAVVVTSNTVEFSIVAADPAWQEETLRKALGLVEGDFNYGRQVKGCRMLRFLATDAAVNAIIKHYAEGQFCTGDYRYGLFAFPDRPHVVRQMEDGIPEPSVGISADYLRTLSAISVYKDHPEFLPSEESPDLGKVSWSPPTPTIVPAGTPNPLAAHFDLIDAEEDRYFRELLGALGNKIGSAHALSLEAMLDWPLLRRRDLESTEAALRATLRKQLAEDFLDLPASDQFDLLYGRWPDIAGPAMLPAVRRLYIGTPLEPDQQGQYVSLLLQRITELAPSEGRALTLKEMERPHPRLDLTFYHLLPDREIPELDETLAASLEASNGEEMTIVELIGRYATTAIFPRVLATEEDHVGTMPCEAQAWFVAYALKADARTGAQLLEKALAARDETHCYTLLLGWVARRRSSPEVEQSAITHLDDPDLEVAANAAGTLGAYGSPAAELPLWERLQKWHQAWAGRAAELPDGARSALTNGLETALEMALVNALATAQSWVAGPETLQRVRALCVSQYARGQVDNMLNTLSSTPHIGVNTFGDGSFAGNVYQYQADSVEALEEKLAQLPSGTMFSVELNGSDPQELKKILNELKSVTEEHGSKIDKCRFWDGTPSESEIPNSNPESPCCGLPMTD